MKIPRLFIDFPIGRARLFSAWVDLEDRQTLKVGSPVVLCGDSIDDVNAVVIDVGDGPAVTFQLLDGTSPSRSSAPSYGAGLPEPVGFGFDPDCEHSASVQVTVNRQRPARERLR